MEQVGIKETKLLLESAMKVGLIFVPVLKDGVQITDVVQLYNQVQSHPELLSALGELQKHIGEIPAEIKDLSMAEGIELAVDAASFVPQILAALKA